MNVERLTRPLLAAFLFALAPQQGLADTLSEQAAAELLHKKLAKEAPEDKALLESVKGKEVIVVQGGMDHIEDVLRAARIRHTVISPNQVADYPLRSKMIVMINCPGQLPQSGIARIEKFVRAGGLLYTTDWALLNVVQRAFPGTVAFNGVSTGDEVVPVQITKANDNLMSRMLLRQGSEPQWWLEGGSYPIKILDESKVDVLARSAVMGRRYGAAPVVVRFRWEDGEVIHVVSHFYRQMATKGPKVAVKDMKIEGLSDDELASLKKSAAGEARAGDVESSYAFQKMTTNIVVGKQRRNAELERMYNQTVKGSVPMRAAPGAGAGAGGLGVATQGTRLKVLKRQDGQAHVRDEAGNEGWVPEAELMAL